MSLVFKHGTKTLIESVVRSVDFEFFVSILGYTFFEITIGFFHSFVGLPRAFPRKLSV